MGGLLSRHLVHILCECVASWVHWLFFLPCYVPTCVEYQCMLLLHFLSIRHSLKVQLSSVSHVLFYCLSDCWCITDCRTVL